MNTRLILTVSISIIIFSLIVTAVRMAISRNWLTSTEVKDYIIKLILKAEEVITGTKAGQERLAWVISYLYGAMPDYIKAFVTLDDIAETINYLFEQIAVTMEDGTRKAIRKD